MRSLCSFTQVPLLRVASADAPETAPSSVYWESIPYSQWCSYERICNYTWAIISDAITIAYEVIYVFHRLQLSHPS